MLIMERVLIPIMAIMMPNRTECMISSSVMQCQVVKAVIRVAKARPVRTVKRSERWKV